MLIDIKASDFPLTEALRNHADRRLRSALTCCGQHIRRVTMRLSDVNGPRGGADKRCRLRVALAGLPDVVVEDTQADLYTAIDRATDRAGRTPMPLR
jgi:ribosome-associated translation inhibitor RaiA